MKLETFFDKFDLFADAPDAVEKMRELVLDLAVQGKVADQDPNDQPAAELLNRLIQFKLDNPLTGRSGRSKEGPVEVEASRDGLPQNWVNTTIGEVLYVIRGASPRPKGDPQYFSEARTPYHWVKISDIRKHGQNGLLMDTDEFLTEAGMRKSVLLPKGTLVLTNSATIGVPIVLGIEGCCIHDGYLAFPNFPHDLLSQKFLLYLFHTLKKHAERNARGLAQLNLNTDLVRSFPFGLPPLAEQKRIVAKVDELMALCDRLEAQQQEREEQASQLARASLARFADAPSPANVDYLFHSSYSISPSDLRKSILTLAVQGKLVPQDPNDEPADVLLTRIRRKKGGVEDDDTGTDEKPSLTGGFSPPFEIPSTWAWVRSTEPTQSISDLGKKIKTKDVAEKGRFPVVDQGKQFIRGYCDDEEKVIHHDTPIVLFGDHTRETKLIDFDFVVGADGVKLLKPIEINPSYYLLALRWLPLDDRGYGRHFKLLRAASIPIPPLAEQRRIVAKVEQLMALVDALETQLAASRATAANLLSALVAELTA